MERSQKINNISRGPKKQKKHNFPGVLGGWGGFPEVSKTCFFCPLQRKPKNPGAFGGAFQESQILFCFFGPLQMCVFSCCIVFVFSVGVFLMVF